METHSSDLTRENSEILVMSAPREPWKEFILHFATFGIYTCFWFVKRIKEVNQLSNSAYTPWRWFFVPLVLLVQLFTLHKFTTSIEQIEKENGITEWKKVWNIVWMAGIVTITGLFNFTNKIELPGWTVLAQLGTMALLFSIFQIRINAIKKTVSGIEFTKSTKGYSIIEWVCVVLLFPFTILITGYLALEPLLTTEIQALESNSIYNDPNRAYQFPVIGENWAIVENETFSDGTAELELKGTLSNMYYLVFFYGHNEDLNSLSYNRFSEAHENMSTVSCTEKRLFSKTQLSIISRHLCYGKSFGDPAIMLSTIIETKKGIYELYGFLSSVSNSFHQYKNDFKKMAEGFEPL